IDTIAAMTADAAGQGARFVLFPEAFVGGYPWGLAFGTAIGGRLPEGRRGWERYWRGAIDVPGPHTERIGEIAREAGVYLAGGVIERDTRSSRGTLYCTLLYFGPDGSLLGKHRKLKPTASERLIWGEGDGSTMPVLETDLGRMGGLICWENYMPLARAALYGKGVELYLAPTADARDGWQATLRH
ncbi:MAG: nitrilase-related carbon-nitrogen hydrolase, partial [Trueperaceae bacterium]